MPGAAEDHVVFDGFSRGEYGKAASWDIGWRLLRQRLYYAGWFSASNVQRSLQSTLYPRVGLTDITPTGIPNGALTGFVWTEVPNKDLLFSIGNTVYDCPSVAGGAATAYTGTFAITPTVPVAFASTAGGIVYATVYGDKTYKIDQNARTVTALTGSPGGACIAVYQNKLIVANTPSNANRLFYSGDSSALPGSLSDFTIWNALNFIDVGDLWNINTLQPQRLSLIIGKQRSWFLLTGVPGVSDVLRPLNQNGPWVQAPNMAAMAGDNMIWFLDFNKDTPNAFTGSKFAEEEFLSFNGGTYAYTALPPTFAAARLYRNHDMFLGAVTTPGGPMKAVIYQDGAWTMHMFNPPGGFQGAWVAGKDGHSAGLRMASGGTVSTPTKIFGWVSNRDRPPISGQPLESIGDASTTPLAPTVTLPEYWVRSGGEMSLRSVIVDFTRWNHGFASNNHFDLHVQAFSTYGDTVKPGPAGTVQTETYDEAPSAAGSAGTSSNVRITFNFNPEMGNAWQISFGNLVGVEIRKIEVKVQTSPPRGT